MLPVLLRLVHSVCNLVCNIVLQIVQDYSENISEQGVGYPVTDGGFFFAYYVKLQVPLQLTQTFSIRYFLNLNFKF